MGHHWRQFLVAGFGAIAVNTLGCGAAQGMNLRLTISLNDLAPSAGPEGTLRLLSGDNEFSPGVFDGKFDLDEVGEYFDLEIDGNQVGRFGCYDALGIINLNGELNDEGCAFDQSFSLVNDFGLDLMALINEDGSFIVDAIFSDPVELSPIGNNLTVVLSYGVAVPPTNVPAPAAVLPVLGSVLGAALRQAKAK